METFKAIFGRTGAGEVVVYALGIAALYTFFTNMTTWTMGANRAAAEAASDGELPKIFAREHPDAPDSGARPSSADRAGIDGACCS